MPSQEALYYQQLLRASFDHGDWQCIITIQKAFSWTWLFLGAAISAENKTREISPTCNVGGQNCKPQAQARRKVIEVVLHYNTFKSLICIFLLVVEDAPASIIFTTW